MEFEWDKKYSSMVRVKDETMTEIKEQHRQIQHDLKINQSDQVDQLKLSMTDDLRSMDKIFKEKMHSSSSKYRDLKEKHEQDTTKLFECKEVIRKLVSEDQKNKAIVKELRYTLNSTAEQIREEKAAVEEKRKTVDSESKLFRDEKIELNNKLEEMSYKKKDSDTKFEMMKKLLEDKT